MYYIKIGLKEFEWDFFQKQVENLGIDGFLFRLWSRWGIELLNGMEIRWLEEFYKARIIKREKLLYKTIQVEGFIYEVLRSFSEYFEVDMDCFVHYLVHCEMMGDGVGGEGVLSIAV